MSPSPLHALPDFGDLVRVVAAARKVPVGMVEKDYWVVQCLKAIDRLGWGMHFKGGTSLSKGFNIIERFSEDLDLKLEPPGEWALPADHNWKGDKKPAIAARGQFFDRLAREVIVPGCEIKEESRDAKCRSINLRVEYPVATEAPPAPLAAGVLLEIGHARVTPSEPRPIRSWLAEWLLEQEEILEGFDLGPVEVPCVSPTVTLFEKVDAMCRHYPKAKDAAAFIRHYEDAAALVRFLKEQDSKSEVELKTLYQEMVDSGDIKEIDLQSAALQLSDTARNTELERAWSAAEGLHWGARIPLSACAKTVKDFLASAVGSKGSAL